MVMALASKIIDEIGFVDMVNKAIEWDPSRWLLSPGLHAKAIALSTFTDMRSPLTKIPERLSGHDLDFLLEEGAASALGSFSLGRALERIGESGPNSIFQQLAFSAFQLYDIPAGRAQPDASTISFYGDYDGFGEEEGASALKIEQGYNKDNRPKCKQVVIGKITNEHGIPIVCDSLDGATSDVEWNRVALGYLRELQGSGHYADAIYVADSKLMVEDIVSELGKSGPRFVSRCPASFDDKLEHRAISRALSGGAWEGIGPLSESKNATSYKAASFIEPVCGRPMRVVVLHSTSKAEGAQRALGKKDEALKPLAKAMESKEFKCEADALLEIGRFKAMKAAELHTIDASVVKTVIKKWARGRRKAGATPISTTEKYTVKVNGIERGDSACLDSIERESCFVLVSNAVDIGSKELLQIYKGQQAVENSFRMLKEPQLASVIYLESPGRIEALLMVLSFSLLVRAIVQLLLRRGLEKHEEESPGEDLMVGWGGRKLKSPTYKLFYEHSFNCAYIREGPGSCSFSWSSDKTRNFVSTLLALMGFSVESLLN
ncbi:MAG: IS1634 family transposase [Eubacteriaceae bacterium]|nr:IS1634 family transposase [Eubacteriaceae bacterium]